MWLCSDDILKPWLKPQDRRGRRVGTRPLEITCVLLLHKKTPPRHLCSRAWAQWWRRGQLLAGRELGLGSSRWSSIHRCLEVTGIPEADSDGAQMLPAASIFTGVGRSEDVQWSAFVHALPPGMERVRLGFYVQMSYLEGEYWCDPWL